jgi:hypothetical protein
VRAYLAGAIPDHDQAFASDVGQPVRTGFLEVAHTSDTDPVPGEELILFASKDFWRRVVLTRHGARARLVALRGSQKRVHGFDRSANCGVQECRIQNSEVYRNGRILNS